MVIHSQGSCLIWRQPISNWHGANNKRNWRNQHADVFTSLRVYKPPCVIAFDSVWLNSDKRWLSVHGYSAPGNRSIYASPGLISLSQFPMAGQEMCLDKKPATWFGKKKSNPGELIIWETFHPDVYSARFSLLRADILFFLNLHRNSGMFKETVWI